MQSSIAYPEPTRERLLRHPNIFHPDLGAGLGSLRAPGGEPGRTPHSRRECCRRHRRLRRHDRSSHRGHRRRARSRASALLHHRRRRDGGTRRRCARPRGRPRSCVPRASGLAGVAPCFRPTAATIAQAGHPRRGDDARRAVPPQDRPHRPAQPSQDRGHRQRHRLYRFAESRGFDVQAGTRLRGTQRPPRGPDRARIAGGLRRRLVPGDRRVSRRLPLFSGAAHGRQHPCAGVAERSGLSARKQPAPDRVADPRGKHSASSSPCRTSFPTTH